MSTSYEKIHLYADQHAIEVVNFSVILGIPLDAADNSRFENNINRIKCIFPYAENAQGITFAIGPVPPSSPPPPPAKELAYYSNNGQMVWSGRFGMNTNSIIVSCHRYTKWKEIWPEARKRLYELLKCIDPLKPVRSIDYSVTDTFSADTNLKGVLTASNLFKETEYIPRKIRSHVDPRWDFSEGWFDILDNDDELLVRVESQSVIQNDKIVVSINNLHSHRFKSQTTVEAIIRENSKKRKIDHILNQSHDMNKHVLKNLITDDILQRMKLTEVPNV